VRVVELTVLVHEGPIARAYLEALRLAGIRPARIVLMVYGRDPGTGKPVGRWLPSGLRLKHAARVQDLRLNYWSRALRRTQPQLFEAITRTTAELVTLPRVIYEGMLSHRHWSEYGDEFEQIMVGNVNDAAVAQALARNAPTAVLYTGGGILRDRILAHSGLRFIHLHPGLVPHVRGADGLLWSTLVRRRPAVSCFYMAPGLDTGDVIDTQEFSPVRFEPAGILPDDATLYRALYAYVDPLLRAALLMRLLDSVGDARNLPTRAQNTGAGVTYHFMHPAVRRMALAQIFPSLKFACR